MIQPSATVISIGLKITKTTTNHQNNTTAETTACAILWYTLVWETQGAGGAAGEGRREVGVLPMLGAEEC